VMARVKKLSIAAGWALLVLTGVVLTRTCIYFARNAVPQNWMSIKALPCRRWRHSLL